MADAMDTSLTKLTRSQVTARFILRGDLAGLAYGPALPSQINQANGDETRAALKLGPDEWLLLACDEGVASLEQKFASFVGAVVDVTHRQIGLLLEGSQAAEFLNAAVPLDLSLAAFPVGMATRTIFDKCDIVLWRTEPQKFHIEVWRSFAPYVEGLLQTFMKDAAAPYDG